MIRRLQLLKNVGQFESAAMPNNQSFNRLTLIFGENGRGKTTVSAILTSLLTGDTRFISERHRLDADDPSHVVIDFDSNTTIQFHNGAWAGTAPPMLVFDDAFVDANVCSGLAVSVEHRHKLHELILGTRGVTLNNELQACVQKIEEHNSKLKRLAAATPASIRGDLTVEQFCSLTVPPDIDESLAAAQRNLAALQQSEAIRTAHGFPMLTLPAIDSEKVCQLLQRDVEQLSTDAMAMLQEHFLRLGHGGEEWVSAGVARVIHTDGIETCPFCAQSLAGSPVYEHVKGYFGEAYKNLKTELALYSRQFNHDHSDDAPAAFERSVRVAVERRAFWSQFCDVPEVAIDTANIARKWKACREAIVQLLTAKQQTPLERFGLSADVEAILKTYDTCRQEVDQINSALRNTKEAIDAVKERAGAGNIKAVQADLTRLRAIKERSTSEIQEACNAYLAEEQAKRTTEEVRDNAKTALKNHRETVFPRYQDAINEYLRKFNANFRLTSVQAADTRGGPTCNYGVLVDSSPNAISVTASDDGLPSFKTALSSGDRNTLALAFFLASVDEHPRMAELVVIVDDPINSLDDHRTIATSVEIRKLLQRVTQVIVLSHNKPFLCRLWESSERQESAAFEIRRSASGSVLTHWDVTQDCITEHDKRHAQFEEFVTNGSSNLRDVAQSVRPHLEAFCRIAYPRWFPPGTLLGPFRSLCDQRTGQPNEILSSPDTEELNELTEYGNRYHHDTNPSWETENINETELLGYVRRVLAFTRRA